MVDSPLLCPRCNEPSGAQSSYCQRCGAALTPPPPPPPASGPENSPTKRLVFVLLAILPAFCLAIGGIHSLVAGYNQRGGMQLALSIVVWIFGVIGAVLVLPLCIGIPAWIALVIWCVVDAVQVTKDAQGRPMV